MVNSTVEFTHNNPDVIFTRADKGSVTALNKNVYINKVEELLSDKGTYEVIKRNPALSIERNLNETLKKWLRLEYISKKEYFHLYSSDSNLPKVYASLKSTRPIIPSESSSPLSIQHFIIWLNL